jgi:hypothetical protein
MSGVSAEAGQPNPSSPPYLTYLWQAAAGLILVFEISLAIDGSGLALLFSPIAIGSLFPLFWWFGWPISAVERWGPALELRRNRASFEFGKLANARHNMWAGAHALWRLAAPVQPESVRAGTRATLLIYYFGAFAALLAFLAYIGLVVLVVIVMVIALFLALLLWLHVSSDGPDSGDEENTSGSSPRQQPSRQFSTESWVDQNHVRVTSPDGKRSWLYTVDEFGFRDCTEIADHGPDGKTWAWERGDTLDDAIFDGKGKRK